jgi:imidazolonepropionase-like amidohydrolase
MMMVRWNRFWKFSETAQPNGARARLSIGHRRALKCHVAITIVAMLLATTSASRSHPLLAAEPIPGEFGFERRDVLLTGARVILAPGRELPTGSVLVRGGRIAAVAERLETPPGVERLDLSGYTIYPGFVDCANTAVIDTNAPLPAVEPIPRNRSSSVMAGLALDHHSGLTPQLRTAEVLLLDRAAAWRQAGLCVIHAVPSGRLVSGVTAVVQPNGGPLSASVVAPHPDRGLRWMSVELLERFGNEYPATLMGTFAHLRQKLIDTQWQKMRRGSTVVPSIDENPQDDAVRVPRDPVLLALEPLSARTQTPLFRVSTRDDIERALSFSTEQGWQPVLWGPAPFDDEREAIVKAGARMILNLDATAAPKLEPAAPDAAAVFPEFAEVPAPLAVRQAAVDRWKKRMSIAARLGQADVPFAMSSAGLKSPDEFLRAVRQAMVHGLSHDKALAALTTTPAAWLGVEQHVGDISPGKWANLVVLNGSLGDDGLQVRYAFVDGYRFEPQRDAKPLKPAGQPPSATSPPPIDVGGPWELTIQHPDSPVVAQLRFEQSGTAITGVFRSRQGEGVVSLGKLLPEDGIEFHVSIGAGASNVVLKFMGRALPPGPDSKAATDSDSPQPTTSTETTSEGHAAVRTITAIAQRLEGTVTSAFGAPIGWTARRQSTDDAAVESASGTSVTAGDMVQLQTVESSDPPSSPQTGDESEAAAVSALEPIAAAAAGRASQPQVTSQELPTEFPEQRRGPARRFDGPVLLTNATVLTGDGQELLQHDLLLEAGKIQQLGPALPRPDGVTVIDLSGKFVMPGIIDTHSHIMISQGLGGVNEGTASIVCEVRVGDVINTADTSEYHALAGGVTTARLLHGSANVIGGQDAVVQLKHGANAKDHLFPEAHSGVKFALGENVKFRQGRFPNTRLGVEATLQRAFVEALDYRRRWQEFEAQQKTDTDAMPPRRDLRLEALSQILNHEKFIHSHCYRSDEILMLLRVAQQFGVRVWSLQHVLEGYKVAPEIVAHGSSCSTFADWWAYKVEAYDAAPHNAALLHEAGANVVIKSDDAELMRHLYQEVQKPIRYGNLSPDVALSLITRNAAKELGLDDRIGTIAVGKQADLAVFNAHPLNSFARCEQTWVAGELQFDRTLRATAMTTAGVSRSANPVPVLLPAAEQRRAPLDLSRVGPKVAFTQAMLHPVDGPDVEHGTLLVVDGRITAMGKDVAIPDDFDRVELAGLHVYPGLIDAGTTVGLSEIGKVTETNDVSETGGFQPDLRAGVAINPDSELIPVARIGGITTALVKPAGGIICGQSSVVNWAGWTAPEMVLQLEAGLEVHWPGYREQPQHVQQLVDWWQAARRYHGLDSRPAKPLTASGVAESESAESLAVTAAPTVESSGVESAAQGETEGRSDRSARESRPRLVDPRFEALGPYVRRERPVFIQAESRQHLLEALAFADTYHVKVVLTGAADAWKVADQLVARRIPVVVGPVMRKPVEDYDPFDAPYANAGRLYDAGVSFCFRSNTAANSRNAPFEAAMAVAYGLPESAALRAVTLSAAEILGVADQCGSLTVGKRADLVILDGSPLQVTSQIKGVMVGGQGFSLESRQTRLYERYRQRLREWRQKHAQAQH